MEFLKDLGILGFWFFLIKGILWLVLLALVYFGLIDKSRMQSIKSKLSLRRRKKDPSKKS